MLPHGFKGGRSPVRRRILSSEEREKKYKIIKACYDHARMLLRCGIGDAKKCSARLLAIALGCTLLNAQDMSSIVLASIQMVTAVRPLEPAPATVRDLLAPAQAITPAQRWARYLQRTYSAPRLGLLAVDIAVDQALREPACWDRGATSYGRRYMRALDRRVIRNSAELAAGLLTGEDLRYIRSSSVRPPARAWHAVRRAFIARMPNGSDGPAYTRFAAAAVAEVSTAHWVGQPVRTRWMVHTLVGAALDQVQTNLLDEFGPDFRRIGYRMLRRVRRQPEVTFSPIPSKR